MRSDRFLAQRLERLFGAAVEAGEVPGVVALVTDANADRWVGAFGVRRLGDSDPMRVDTIGWIASMTKPLTTAVALQLVERGMLDLDAPAADWVPALGELPVLEGFDADGRPRLRPARATATLRQLLTHTGGLGYDFWSRRLSRYQQWRSAQREPARGHRYFGFPLLADPGTRWNYGVGIDWTGRVIEAATGQRLGDVVARQLTGPLGMSDTRFGVRPEDRGRLASMHQRAPDGSLVATATDPPAEPEWHMGGGGMYGTAPDYGRFIRLILAQGRHEGRTILGPGSIEAMSTNQIGRLRVAPLRAAMPELSHDAEFFPGIEKDWTLGFQINLEAAPTGRSAGSLMWAGLANGFFWIDPAAGLGGALLTQILPFCDPKSLALFYAFERTVYDTLVG